MKMVPVGEAHTQHWNCVSIAQLVSPLAADINYHREPYSQGGPLSPSPINYKAMEGLSFR
jgi:hypothetical protein